MLLQYNRKAGISQANYQLMAETIGGRDPVTATARRTRWSIIEFLPLSFAKINPWAISRNTSPSVQQLKAIFRSPVPSNQAISRWNHWSGPIPGTDQHRSSGDCKSRAFWFFRPLSSTRIDGAAHRPAVKRLSCTCRWAWNVSADRQACPFQGSDWFYPYDNIRNTNRGRSSGEPHFQNDDMICAFPPDRGDHPFNKRILPRALRGRDHLFDGFCRRLDPPLAALPASAMMFSFSVEEVDGRWGKISWWAFSEVHRPSSGLLVFAVQPEPIVTSKNSWRKEALSSITQQFNDGSSSILRF